MPCVIHDFDSLAPVRCPKIVGKQHFQVQVYLVILQLNLSVADAKVLNSTLVQVVAWYRQKTSHNPSQC